MPTRLVFQKPVESDPFERVTVEFEGRQYHVVGHGKEVRAFADRRVAAALDSASDNIRAAGVQDGDLGGSRNFT